ncbi:MAG: DNA repair protein RadC [Nitrospirae bacterium]|nr:DNA repair protein RadC [Nitrospirota bacterium]
MRVKVGGAIQDVEGKMRVRDLLKRLELLPEVVLVAKNGEVVTEDEMVGPQDEVEIIKAISGGSDGPPSAPSDAAAYHVPIREWPEAERPREKLIQAGAESLTDPELIAILLRTGARGTSAIDLARRLLRLAGGLGKMVRSDPDKLRRIKGVGTAKVAQILAALELGRRVNALPASPAVVIRSSADVAHLAGPLLKDLRKEVLDVLLLNTRNKLLARERVSRGTVNRSAAFSREVFECGLRRQAAALILVHNHPSGDPTPSAEDEQFTREMVWGGEIMNLCVLDHVIVGGADHYSFADAGRIDAMRREAPGRIDDRRRKVAQP